MGNRRWRRPQKNEDVLQAAVIAQMRQLEREGLLEQFFAAMDEQGFGAEAREVYERDKLQQQGIECMDCGGEGECVACGTAPEQLPQPGWYDDPEDDGYVRWWNGHEWIGGPIDPEHAIGPDADTETTAGGFHRYVGA